MWNRRNPLLRWLRRRWRRHVRLLWVAWTPLALMSDLVAMSLEWTGFVEAPASSWLAGVSVHVLVLCAAAYRFRVGAAAAVLDIPSLVYVDVPTAVVDIQISIQYSIPSLVHGMCLSVVSVILHSVLLACRLAELVARVVCAYPYSIGVWLALHCVDLL